MITSHVAGSSGITGWAWVLTVCVMLVVVISLLDEFKSLLRKKYSCMSCE